MCDRGQDPAERYRIFQDILFPAVQELLEDVKHFMAYTAFHMMAEGFRHPH